MVLPDLPCPDSSSIGTARRIAQLLDDELAYHHCGVSVVSDRVIEQPLRLVRRPVSGLLYFSVTLYRTRRCAEQVRGRLEYEHAVCS